MAKALSKNKIKEALEGVKEETNSKIKADLKVYDPEGDKEEKKLKSEKKKPKVKAEKKASYADNQKMLHSRRMQLMTKTGLDQGEISPLQASLVQSESLRIAQDKITELEEEIILLRQKNEKLIFASDVLKNKNKRLQSERDDFKYKVKEQEEGSNEEKEILLKTLEDAKRELNLLKSKKRELEKRLSHDFHGIRARESSLESRLEILKMESTVLQREKDKAILELKKRIRKMKGNLDELSQKNQEIQSSNNKLQEGSRRTVSALRMAIHNLEGVQTKEAGSLEDTTKTEEEESE